MNKIANRRLKSELSLAKKERGTLLIEGLNRTCLLQGMRQWRRLTFLCRTISVEDYLREPQTMITAVL